MGIWENILKVVAIILVISGVPGYIYLVKITKDPISSVIILVLYEIIILVGGFFYRIILNIEGRWIKRISNDIDVLLQSVFYRFRYRYNKYITFQHRYFDVKGLMSQGPFNLELERVFVELCVVPTPITQITNNPLVNLPADLFSGNHTIWEYINNSKIGNQNLAIIGPPGCGKTTLLKHIALCLAAPFYYRKTNGIPKFLPILLFLRDHINDIKENPDVNLSKLICDQFQRKQAPLPPEGWLSKQLEKGRCLIMFDGLDEVADQKIREFVVNWVEKCMGAYGNNRFIITSRPFGYIANPLSNVTVLQIKPLTNDKVKKFIRNWYLANEIMSSQCDDVGVRNSAKLGADDLITRISATQTLSDLSINPLLLTMIATVHRYRSSLPGRRVELYAEILEVFLGKRQEARGIVSDLTPAQKQRVLQPLAYKLMTSHLREMQIEEIESLLAEPLESVNPNITVKDFIKDIEDGSGLLVEREIGVYSFSHLTFQEYLAAIHVQENHLERQLSINVNNHWWHETIRLFCAQTDASKIIDACLKSSTVLALSLAFQCNDEAREVNTQVREKLTRFINDGIESSNPDYIHLIADAYLKKRLKS